MKNELKAQLTEAVRLKERGEFGAAEKILVELSAQDPDSKAILAVLGQVYWEMKRLDEAVEIFQRTVALAPESEAISLGLFHCLWDSGKREEALEEIKRFTLVSDSPAYTEIVQEINAKW